MASYTAAKSGAKAAAKLTKHPALILRARVGEVNYSSRRTDGTLKAWNDAERNGWEVVEIVEAPQ